MGYNVSEWTVTIDVNDNVFSEPTYTKRMFTYYGGSNGCSVLSVGK